MVVRYELNKDEPLTEEQIEMLKSLESFNDEPDDECPPLTDEQLEEVRKKSGRARSERRKKIKSAVAAMF